MLVLRKGYESRDSDGNLVATLPRDLRFGEIVKATDVVLPGGSHPLPGQRVHPAIERVLPV